MVAAVYVVATGVLTLTFSEPVQASAFTGQPLTLEGLPSLDRRNVSNALITGGLSVAIPTVQILQLPAGAPRVSYSAVGSPIVSAGGQPLPAFANLPLTLA